MLAQHLVPLLQEQFGFEAFTIGHNPLITFPATCLEVGDLRIFEVGAEGRIEVGDLTHGHFYSFGSYPTPEEAAQELAENILDFVREVFANRVVFWRTKGGNTGGWFIIEDSEEVVSPVQQPTEMFFWSGAIK